MEEEKMSNLLHAYYNRRVSIPERGKDCPTLESLERYVSGLLPPQEQHDITGHVRSCGHCNELIEGALLYASYGRYIRPMAVRRKIKDKAKRLHPQHRKNEVKMKTAAKKSIWPALFILSLSASFLVPRYFVQFLILALVMGLKWVFDKESARALIMIYNARKKHDKDGEREIDEILKNRL